MINKNKYSTFELISFSAAALYFELAIIRFTAAEVLYLGYFSNFILISSFVGLGLGFLSARKEINLDFYLPFLMLFLFSLVLVSQFDVEILKNHFGLFFFGNIKGRAGLPGALLLIILFITTVMFFLCIGRRIALAFMKFGSLKAYTYDITGSLIGIILFSLQSLAASRPTTWVMTGTLLLVLGYLFSNNGRTRTNIVHTVIASICVIIILISAQSGVFTIWSSYQKLQVIKRGENSAYTIFANGIVHQFMNPVSVAKDYYYAYPYKLMNDHGLEYNKVLIIGAGSGTDVAVALEFGAAEIDAVEIDAKILEIGKYLHPDKPYDDNRVSLYVADGRQFLKNIDKKYDLIVFALPDSLMRLSAMSSVRLESFLFTLEAFEDVKKHLSEKGVFVMYNQYRWQWLVNKIAASLDTVFGKPPVIFKEGPTTLFAIGNNLQGSEYQPEGFEKMATDDWPFVYMQKPTIHWLYIGMIAVFLLASVIGIWFFAPAGTLRKPEFPFFFMGMAFLLLETKSLSFFSLLFGTTWVVNSMAFAGILLSVLIANLLVQYYNLKIRIPLFVALFLCLITAYLIPPSVFLNIDIFWV